jgi:hypothetical protein
MIDMLHDNVSFEWRWNYWPLSGNAGISKVLVEEPTSPMESDGWSKHKAQALDSNTLSILITLSTDDKSGRRNENARDQALHDDILPYVDHVTIMVAKMNGSTLDGYLWFNIFLLSKALASRSPHLTTLRIVAQESQVAFDTWTMDAKDAPKSAASKKFFPSPYESLAGLPLCVGPVQSARTPKGYPWVQDSTLGNSLNLKRPTHTRMDSSMGSSLVVKRSEWVYSSVRND